MVLYRDLYVPYLPGDGGNVIRLLGIIALHQDEQAFSLILENMRISDTYEYGSLFDFLPNIFSFIYI